MLHELCYQNFVKHNEEKGSRLLCPMCRTPIDKEKVVKKVLEAKPDIGGHEDPFALGGGDKVHDDVVVSAPVGSAPIDPSLNPDDLTVPNVQAPNAPGGDGEEPLSPN